MACYPPWIRFCAEDETSARKPNRVQIIILVRLSVSSGHLVLHLWIPIYSSTANVVLDTYSSVTLRCALSSCHHIFSYMRIGFFVQDKVNSPSTINNTSIMERIFFHCFSALFLDRFSNKYWILFRFSAFRLYVPNIITMPFFWEKNLCESCHFARRQFLGGMSSRINDWEIVNRVLFQCVTASRARKEEF